MPPTYKNMTIKLDNPNKKRASQQVPPAPLVLAPAPRARDPPPTPPPTRASPPPPPAPPPNLFSRPPEMMRYTTVTDAEIQRLSPEARDIIVKNHKDYVESVNELKIISLGEIEDLKHEIEDLKHEI